MVSSEAARRRAWAAAEVEVEEEEEAAAAAEEGAGALLPLLEFGRERESIDLSKVVLTRHKLIHKGKQAMPLNEGETPTLEPITEAGSGGVQEKGVCELGARDAGLQPGEGEPLGRWRHLQRPSEGGGLPSVLYQYCRRDTGRQR